MGNSGGTEARFNPEAAPPHAADAHRVVASVPPTMRDRPETCLLGYDLQAVGRDSWTETDASKEVPVQLAKDGVGAETPQTLNELFKKAAQNGGSKLALRVERPCPPFVKGQPCPKGEWKPTWTWKEYYESVRLASKAFIAAGLQPHEAVAIYGFNSPEWLMSELAAIMTGGVAAGIYPTDTPAQVKYKTEHSNASVACVDNISKAKMFLGLGLPRLRLVVVWGECDPEEVAQLGEGGQTQVVAWDAMGTGRLASDEELDKRIEDQKPGNCCAYIYTSGTTGQPKAVMISHDNITFIAKSVVHTLPFICETAETHERVISYLPLSHVAGMMVDIVLPILCTANRPGHFTISFARPYDLKEGTVVDRLKDVLPTIFLGVPRVWEKIQEKMVATIKENPPTGIKKFVATKAKEAGLYAQQQAQLGGEGGRSWFHGFYDSKVYTQVKSKLGLTECKFAFTGAAPISVDTLEFFGALGLNINECYGMSECCGATTWSTDKAHVWGSCGWALPGVEVKCLREESPGVYTPAPPAADLKNPKEEEQGEICFRGRHVMMGYMANANLGEEHVQEIRKKNAESIDKDGWLHSGDKGTVGRNGMVRITGRFKELIIGAGGENVAPVPIENFVKKIQPAVSNIMMIGDKQKFNVAFVTLKAKGATGDLPGTDELSGEAADLVAGVTTISEASKNKEFIEKIMEAITKANKNGDVCPSNAAKIQKFSILPLDFSVQTGELTPTLKLKRSAVEKQHAALVTRIYESKEAYVPFTAE